MKKNKIKKECDHDWDRPLEVDGYGVIRYCAKCNGRRVRSSEEEWEKELGDKYKPLKRCSHNWFVGSVYVSYKCVKCGKIKDE